VLGSFTKEDLLERLLMLPVLILSLSVHEWAHAWSAYKLGDDTAAREGRLTLNPMAHIDPIGTILLPLLRIPFGWAKPVPVNPLRFRREVTMKAGMMITAAAGPLSNVVLALASTVLMGLLGRFGFLHVAGNGLAVFLMIFVRMNVGLAVFNLLPIPPLDGSRIADGLMPYRLRPQWEQFMRYGSFLLLAIIMFGFGRGLITKPILVVTDQLDVLRHLIAGY
jgi:Zn-dependent protease